MVKIGSGADKYQLFDFAVAGFDDYDGVRKSIANSSFNVPIGTIQPAAEVRNYS